MRGFRRDRESGGPKTPWLSAHALKLRRREDVLADRIATLSAFFLPLLVDLAASLQPRGRPRNGLLDGRSPACRSLVETWGARDGVLRA
jgi:hypothetical protein